jgi:hypothetical protein
MGDLTRQLKKSKLGGAFEKIQEPEMRDRLSANTQVCLQKAICQTECCAAI